MVSVVIPVGEAVWCFPFRPHRELSPSRPRADVATRPLGFLFSHQTPMSVPRREFCCRRVFGFVISLVAEMKMGGDGGDNSVCQGMDGARHKALSALSESIPRPTSEPEIRWRAAEPVTKADRTLRCESLLPSPFQPFFNFQIPDFCS